MSSSRFTPCITGLVYGTLWDYHLQQCFVSPYLLVIAAVLCLETSVSTSLGDSCLPFYQPTWFPPWQSETFHLVSPLLLRLFLLLTSELSNRIWCLPPAYLPACEWLLPVQIFILNVGFEKRKVKQKTGANRLRCFLPWRSLQNNLRYRNLNCLQRVSSP